MTIKMALLGMVGSLPFEVIDVPEVGADTRVRVSVMSGAERDEFDSAWRAARDRDGDQATGFRAMLAVYTLRDPESGERLFNLQDLSDVNRLPATLLDRAASVALRINRLAAGAVESAEKNS